MIFSGFGGAVGGSHDHNVTREFQALVLRLRISFFPVEFKGGEVAFMMVLAVLTVLALLESTLPSFPVLPFLVFLEFLVFSPCEEFLVFLSVFPFFSRDFRGSAGIKNPCFFGGFPCNFPKKQGKEGQGFACPKT